MGIEWNKQDIMQQKVEGTEETGVFVSELITVMWDYKSRIARYSVLFCFVFFETRQKFNCLCVFNKIF